MRICVFLLIFSGLTAGWLSAGTLSVEQIRLFYGQQSKVCHNFYVVQEGALYRSAQLAPDVLACYVQALGIKTVINLRGKQADEAWWLEEQAVCYVLGTLFDSVGLSYHFLSERDTVKQLLDLFDHAPRPILIHCMAGADRTGEAAALWVREIQHKSKEEALRQLSIKYHHFWLAHPGKRFFQEIWQGRRWLIHEYEPKNYKRYAND